MKFRGRDRSTNVSLIPGTRPFSKFGMPYVGNERNHLPYGVRVVDGVLDRNRVEIDQMIEDTLRSVEEPAPTSSTINRLMSSTSLVPRSATGERVRVAQAQQLTDAQVRTLALGALGEAEGEGLPGMEAVLHVVRNRTVSPLYPDDPVEVMLQPWQFSTFNTPEMGGGNQAAVLARVEADPQLLVLAEEAVRNVFERGTEDPTGGALNYHADYANPGWGLELQRRGFVALAYGNHIFYPPPGVVTKADEAVPTGQAAPRLIAFRSPPNEPGVPTLDITDVDGAFDVMGHGLAPNIDLAAAEFGSLLYERAIPPATPNNPTLSARQRIEEARAETRLQQINAQLVDARRDNALTDEQVADLYEGILNLRPVPPIGIQGSAPGYPLTLSEIIVERSAAKFEPPPRVGRLSDEFTPNLPAGVSRVTPEGLNVREVPTFRVDGQGNIILTDDPVPVRAAPTGQTSSRGATGAAMRRVAAAKRLAAAGPTGSGEPISFTPFIPSDNNVRTLPRSDRPIPPGTDESRLPPSDGLPEPGTSSGRIPYPTADQIVDAQRREQLARRRPVVSAVSQRSLLRPTSFVRPETPGRLPAAPRGISPIGVPGTPGHPMPVSPLPPRPKTQFEPGVMPDTSAGGGRPVVIDPELKRRIDAMTDRVNAFPPVPRPRPDPSTVSRPASPLPSATTPGANRTGVLSDENARPARVTTQTVTTQRPVTRTRLVPNPDYAIFMGQLANNERMTPTGSVINAELFRAINDPNYRPPARPRVRPAPPPQFIEEEYTEYETIHTVVRTPIRTVAPSRPVYPTISGSATGQQYIVGQRYQGSQGYVLEAQADGTFRRTGERSAGYEGLSPSASYDQAAAAARQSQEYGGSVNAYEATQQRTSQEESRARSMQSTIGS